MIKGGTKGPGHGLSVLLVDSDPEFLRQSCKLIAEDGHRAWGAEDLLAAANFLSDLTPDLLAVELALLEADGADPLGDLRARAPGAPTILMASGPPGERFHAFARLHDIYGYYDKEHGGDCLRLWVGAALVTARHAEVIRQTRRGLRRVLEAVPELHKIQSLDEVLETILGQVAELVGGESGFVAARVSDPVGKPPIEGFSEFPQTIDDYVVSAANVDAYPRGATVDRLKSVPSHLVRRAVDERCNIIDDHHGVLPLALAQHVLGLAYLNKPNLRERDLDVLQVFASQAAAAIRNAALYELATVDSTTRVFRKSFTLERLRETLKLAWRKGFPVSVLMLDIDGFKELNDAHGHIVGDRALRYLGIALKRNVRDSDVVGRFGGDEFILILIDANRDGAEIVANRLHEALGSERGMPWPEGIPRLKTLMGTATLEPGATSPMDLGFPDFPRAVERLVDEADAAMYQARRAAKRIFTGPTLGWADFLES
ncbi:MAG: diguanylate cyclase [Gemmatimonadota bacterium]|nr:MAG: diguanylate cyclase [Gemmatimonadota bacterium]